MVREQTSWYAVKILYTLHTLQNIFIMIFLSAAMRSDSYIHNRTESDCGTNNKRYLTCYMVLHVQHQVHSKMKTWKLQNLPQVIVAQNQQL